MPREIELLDDAQLRREVARCQAAGIKASFRDGGGLFLKVTPAGRARFVHNYPYRGRTPEHWFKGDYPKDISLREARRQWALDRAILKAGRDPLNAGEEAIKEPTFIEFCRAHYKRLAPPMQRELPVEETRWFKDMNGRIGVITHMKIDQIGLEDVQHALARYWDGDRPKPTARHLADAIKRVLDHRHITARPHDLTWVNPIVFKRLRKLNGDAPHTRRPRRSLRWRDAPPFMETLKAQPDLSARLLEFIILTGCRLNEARLAKWGQIKLTGGGSWVIPGEVRKTERHKKGEDAKPFTIPLSPASLDCLKRAAQHMRCAPGDYIFPSYRKGKVGPYSRNAPLDVLQRIIPEVTVHGFRASLQAWGIMRGHEKRGPFGRDLMDACLAHAIKVADNGVRLSEASANYGHDDEQDPYLDRRRGVMRAWGKFLCPPAAKPTAPAITYEGNVTPMRRAA